MRIEPLTIEGAWRAEPVVHSDERGTFLEWFKGGALEAAVGHGLTVEQSNLSTSRSGTIRGIHFADVPPSQAKYVTCVAGTVLDVVVDLRVGSATFGRHEMVTLDDRNRHGVYVSEGLGHGYVALTDGAAVLYLCSTAYAPTREHGVNPLDPEMGIAWPDRAADGSPLEHLLSPKDRDAPSLTEARERGLLPSFDEAVAFRRTQTAAGPTSPI